MEDNLKQAIEVMERAMNGSAAAYRPFLSTLIAAARDNDRLVDETHRWAAAVKKLEGERATPAAPADDALLVELEQAYREASPVLWGVHVGDYDDVLIFEDENGDGYRPNPYHPICQLEDMGDDKQEAYAVLIKNLVNAAPALLARVRQAEAKVAPAGILSNGDFVNRLVDLAKAYRGSAQASIARNSHMHDLPLGEESVPDQSQIDAVLTNFLNHVGVSRGLDLGLYSSDLAAVKGGQPHA